MQRGRPRGAPLRDQHGVGAPLVGAPVRTITSLGGAHSHRLQSMLLMARRLPDDAEPVITTRAPLRSSGARIRATRWHCSVASLLRNASRFATLLRARPKKQPVTRHCERSEAILLCVLGEMDCFVASLLAMTGKQLVSPAHNVPIKAVQARRAPVRIFARNRRKFTSGRVRSMRMVCQARCAAITSIPMA